MLTGSLGMVRRRCLLACTCVSVYVLLYASLNCAWEGRERERERGQTDSSVILSLDHHDSFLLPHKVALM